MLINDCHGYVHHSGVRATLAELRTRSWIARRRQIVKKVLSRCVICKKQQGKPYDSPITADLPNIRVRQAEPFSNVELNFMGPLWIKSSKSEMVKCFIYLFTCCVTRVVHLKLVEDMGVQPSLGTLRDSLPKKGCQYSLYLIMHTHLKESIDTC